MTLAPELVSNAQQRKTVSVVKVGGASTFVASYRAARNSSQRLLFIHGIRGTHHGLEAIVGALPDFECIVPDLPAFGRSEPLTGAHSLAELHAWLEDLVDQFEPDAIVAHSYGTLLVSGAPAAANIRQILINPVVELRRKRAQKISSRVTKAFYDLCTSLGERWGRKLCSARILVDSMSFGLASKQGKDVRRWVFAQHREYFSSFASLQSLVQHSELATSLSIAIDNGDAAPRLLIAATDDAICDIDQVRKLAEASQATTLIELEGYGHLVHYEAPELAARAIESFVGES